MSRQTTRVDAESLPDSYYHSPVQVHFNAKNFHTANRSCLKHHSAISKCDYFLAFDLSRSCRDLHLLWIDVLHLPSRKHILICCNPITVSIPSPSLHEFLTQLSIQHLHNVLPNYREHFPSMERPSSRKIQVFRPRMWRDDEILSWREGIPFLPLVPVSTVL